MEKNHLMRQVELETIPCVDPPKAHNPEVHPLCGNKQARSISVVVEQPVGGLGLEWAGQTPHDAQEFAGTEEN